jgi:hypothetical protein
MRTQSFHIQQDFCGDLLAPGKQERPRRWSLILLCLIQALGFSYSRQQIQQLTSCWLQSMTVSRSRLLANSRGRNALGLETGFWLDTTRNVDIFYQMQQMSCS